MRRISFNFFGLPIGASGSESSLESAGCDHVLNGVCFCTLLLFHIYMVYVKFNVKKNIQRYEFKV